MKPIPGIIPLPLFNFPRVLQVFLANNKDVMKYKLGKIVTANLKKLPDFLLVY